MVLRKRATRQTRRLAFTLMEMLVVVAIIVGLMGLGGYYYFGALNDSKISSARTQAENISKAVKAYQIDHGEFPASLEVLLTTSEIGKGPYLERRDALLDPWGKPYQYDVSATRNIAAGAVVKIPDVYTRTPDGAEVGNWTVGKK